MSSFGAAPARGPPPAAPSRATTAHRRPRGRLQAALTDRRPSSCSPLRFGNARTEPALPNAPARARQVAWPTATTSFARLSDRPPHSPMTFSTFVRGQCSIVGRRPHARLAPGTAPGGPPIGPQQRQGIRTNGRRPPTPGGGIRWCCAAPRATACHPSAGSGAVLLSATPTSSAPRTRCEIAEAPRGQTSSSWWRSSSTTAGPESRGCTRAATATLLSLILRWVELRCR